MAELTMEKPKVDAHPSLLIAIADATRELLMSVYDDGYPMEIYRGAANLPGGNPQFPQDKSPLDVLVRELSEEFDIPEEHRGKEGWASQDDVLAIRNALLRNVAPYADFYAHAHHIKKGIKTEYDAIFSAFVALVPQDAIELARQNLAAGRKLVSEGLAGIFTLDELKTRGPYGTAHSTPLLLSAYFGTQMPTPDGFSAKRLDTPIGRSFKEYRAEFEYPGKLKDNPNED